MDNKKMKLQNLFETFKNLGRGAKYFLLALLLVVLISIIIAIVFSGSGKAQFSVETSLKEVLESSELSTAEYTYNSIVSVKDDKKDTKNDEEEIKYYISYKGTVKAGFDFEKIDVVKNDKKIIVIVPEIEIISVDVDTNLEYIFTNKKYDTEKTYAEAYNACCDDLESKAKSNKTLHNTAVESAIEAITALTKPFERQLKKGETIEVVYINQETQEGK